jgi:hypothetical protein
MELPPQNQLAWPESMSQGERSEMLTFLVASKRHLFIATNLSRAENDGQ